MLPLLSRARPEWTQVVRGGMPRFRVSRKTITVRDADGNERVYAQGDEVPASAFVHRGRMRQYYILRLIEPVTWPLSEREKAQIAQVAVRKTQPEPSGPPDPSSKSNAYRTSSKRTVSTAVLSAAQEV